MNDIIEVTIKWKDTQEVETVLFGVGEFNPTMDDQVFFWIDTINELNEGNLSPDFEII